MKTSIIRQRVADFLMRHAPFDALPEEELLTLAGSGKVKFHESEEYLYQRGDEKGPFVWIIQQGRVELLEDVDGAERLRDVLGEGDLLGLERFAGDGTCICAARTATDVILYGVAAEVFEAAVARHAAVQRFLSAHSSVSGALGFSRTSWLEAEAPPLPYLRARMATMVLKENRERSPALGLDFTTRALVRAMLEARKGEVQIAADGTVLGVVTGPELAMFCGYDAAGLVSAIRRAESVAEIRPLLKLATRMVVAGLAQPQDVEDCCRISSEVVAAAADACLRMAERNVVSAGIPRAGAPYCVVMFGASARGDMIGSGLPTIATIYDDSDAALGAEDQLYFVVMAGEIATQFHACGAKESALKWPTGAQPSMPLSEWKRLYSETIRKPIENDLFVRREFFDLSRLAGDESIFGKLRDHVVTEMRGRSAAIALLANDTMDHVPPLTFFHGLVLGMDGAQTDRFDIAEAVISPLSDAARVFALSKRRLAPANTLERFELAAQDYPEGAAVIREAADAFRIGLYYQALEGGPRITPGKLAKFDQLLLKTAFTGIQRFLEFTFTTFVGAG